MPITSAPATSSGSGHVYPTPNNLHDPSAVEDDSGNLARTLKEHRQSVIWSAKCLEENINQYKSRSNRELKERNGPLLKIDNQLKNTRHAMREDSLHDLDVTKPVLTFRQASRNVAVLTGGAASLLGASAVAGAEAVVYGAISAGCLSIVVPASPFVAAYAAYKQWHAGSSVMATLPKRIAKSSKKGAQVFLACATAPVWGPFDVVFDRGAYVPNHFRSINRFPKALAYVKNSTLSTYEIAKRVDEKAARAQAKVEKKFERFPGARRGLLRKEVVGEWTDDGGVRWITEYDGYRSGAEPRFEDGPTDPFWMANLMKCV